MFGEGEIMARFGAFLAFIGFGSALLHFTDIQFKLVIWAEPMQPYLGLGIGGLGALILLIVMASRKEPEEQPAGPQPVAYEPPMAQAQPAQPYGPPSAAPPLPRRVPHQPFAQQPPQGMPLQGMPPQGPPPPYRPPAPQRYGPPPPGGPAPYGQPGQFGPRR
jgi:hypothetical protein